MQEAERQKALEAKELQRLEAERQKEELARQTALQEAEKQKALEAEELRLQEAERQKQELARQTALRQEAEKQKALEAQELQQLEAEQQKQELARQTALGRKADESDRLARVAKEMALAEAETRADAERDARARREVSFAAVREAEELQAKMGNGALSHLARASSALVTHAGSFAPSQKDNILEAPRFLCINTFHSLLVCMYLHIPAWNAHSLSYIS